MNRPICSATCCLQVVPTKCLGYQKCNQWHVSCEREFCSLQCKGKSQSLSSQVARFFLLCKRGKIHFSFSHDTGQCRECIWLNLPVWCTASFTNKSQERDENGDQKPKKTNLASAGHHRYYVRAMSVPYRNVEKKAFGTPPKIDLKR
jgi:hypothetical protein